MARVPPSCTLPTAEQPLRVGEFDALFEDTLQHVHRLDERRVALALRAASAA